MAKYGKDITQALKEVKNLNILIFDLDPSHILIDYNNNAILGSNNLRVFES